MTNEAKTNKHSVKVKNWEERNRQNIHDRQYWNTEPNVILNGAETLIYSKTGEQPKRIILSKETIGVGTWYALRIFLCHANDTWDIEKALEKFPNCTVGKFIHPIDNEVGFVLGKNKEELIPNSHLRTPVK